VERRKDIIVTMVIFGPQTRSRAFGIQLSQRAHVARALEFRSPVRFLFLSPIEAAERRESVTIT
jgi:hypothetical protein